MHMTNQDAFGLVLFVFLGGLIFSAGQYVTAWASGWRRLAKLYPADTTSVPFGHAVSLCWVEIRRDGMADEPLQQPFTGCNFSCTLARFTVCDLGLLARIHAPFSIGLPPLFIPWDDLNLVGRRGRYEYDHNHVIVRVATEESICLVISGETADQLLKLGVPFHLDGEGQLVSNQRASTLQADGHNDASEVG